MSLITVYNLPAIEPDQHDQLLVLGAEIADPENDPSAVPDDSDPASWAFVIAVAPSEDEQPHLDALSAHGLTVTGTNADGNWICEQASPLRT